MFLIPHVFPFALFFVCLIFPFGRGWLKCVIVALGVLVTLLVFTIFCLKNVLRSQHQGFFSGSLSPKPKMICPSESEQGACCPREGTCRTRKLKIHRENFMHFEISAGIKRNTQGLSGDVLTMDVCKESGIWREYNNLWQSCVPQSSQISL